MRKFAIGDIHGCYKGLLQCLQRSEFDYKKDKLIVLGDIFDGWPFSKDCVDEILKIKNLIYILGNHDDWALDWYCNLEDKDYEDPFPPNIWTSQGGEATLESYNFSPMPKKHLTFFIENVKLYHVEDNNLFVHGGINETLDIEDHAKTYLTWDRDLLRRAVMVHPVNPKYKFQDWDTIFIGHTSTQFYTKDTEPMKVCNVINIDTGAGWSGKLTIMDIKTKEYFQSDFVQELYPGIKGRT